MIAVEERLERRIFRLLCKGQKPTKIIKTLNVMFDTGIIFDDEHEKLKKYVHKRYRELIGLPKPEQGR